MNDPFRIEGPAIINVSGGRTSALMLRRVLDAHGGALPDGVVAAFVHATGGPRMCGEATTERPSGRAENSDG